MRILDSGKRREFETGAVRDITEGKGRCDLLPLDIVSDVCGEPIFEYINDYVRTGDTDNIIDAIRVFSVQHYGTTYNAILELSQHYEEGAKKYSDRNWEKGIPCHCYVDSGVRHFIKHSRGDKDEPHDRAFLWNMYGLLWTHHNKPELIDLPFREDVENEN